MTTTTVPDTARDTLVDWLSGALLVRYGSVRKGEALPREKWVADAEAVVAWIEGRGHRLALDEAARLGAVVEAELEAAKTGARMYSDDEAEHAFRDGRRHAVAALQRVKDALATRVVRG